MKLNLGCGTDLRNGFVNIDNVPNVASTADALYRSGDVSNLDWACDNCVASEIVATHVLETVPVDQMKDAVENWATKLERDGTLKIAIVDLYTVAQLFVADKISVPNLLDHLFGAKNRKKLSALDSTTLCSMITSSGLDIQTKRFDGISFYVEAKKL